MKVSDARRQVNDCEKDVAKEYRELIRCVDEVGTNAYAAAVEHRKKKNGTSFILVAVIGAVIGMIFGSIVLSIIAWIVGTVYVFSKMGAADTIVTDVESKRKNMDNVIDRYRQG